MPVARLFQAVVQPGYQAREPVCLFVFHRGKGGAQRRQQRTVFRQDDVFVLQPQILGEGFAQCGDKGKRTAAEQDRSFDVAAMCQRHNRLHGNGMEDGSRNVFPAHVFGYQVLNVRFAEHSATGSNRVYLCRIQCERVQLFDVCSQDNRHLVYERSRTSRAVPVHAEVGRLGILEKHDFGIFPAYVYHGADAGIALLYRFSGGNHFLNERKSQLFGNTHTDRPRNIYAGIPVAQFRQHLFQ